jgi:hypothetical protein
MRIAMVVGTNRENMTQKQIAGWLIELDKKATELAYAERPLGMSCSCHICRNYSAAISSFPSEVDAFFNELGIDIAKPSEIYECNFENNQILYGGFFHIVGSYLSGDDMWQPVAENDTAQKTIELFKITDGFHIGFTQGTALVPDNFPRPVLQMEIRFTAPWILDESYGGIQKG